MARLTAAISIAVCLSACIEQHAVDGPAHGSSAADLAITDMNGRLHHPLRFDRRAATVLTFITVDCPISNAMAPTLENIAADYVNRNVAFYLVHVDPDVTAEDARMHAAEYAFTQTVLLDRRHELVKRIGATVTPECAVFDGSGKLVYQGRIDDLYADFGAKRRVVTQHDLRDALDAVLAGQPVSNPRTEAIGCDIPVWIVDD